MQSTMLPLDILLVSIGLPSVMVLTFLVAGCSSTLPAAPASHIQAPNCSDVRVGNIVWQTSRSVDLEQTVSQQSAIEETLAQLVQHLTGVEIRSLSRSSQSRIGEDLGDQFQLSTIAKAKGRILDYEITSIERNVGKDIVVYRIELGGRVCADDLIDSPLIVALRYTSSTPVDLRSVLESTLSEHFAASQTLALADRGSTKTYSDIDVDVIVADPEYRIVDRTEALTAIESQLGRRSTEGIARQVTRVSLRVTLRASIPAEGKLLTSSEQIERDLIRGDQFAQETVAEMRLEAATRAARLLAHVLSQHVRALKS